MFRFREFFRVEMYREKNSATRIPRETSPWKGLAHSLSLSLALSLSRNSSLPLVHSLTLSQYSSLTHSLTLSLCLPGGTIIMMMREAEQSIIMWCGSTEERNTTPRRVQGYMIRKLAKRSSERERRALMVHLEAHEPRHVCWQEELRIIDPDPVLAASLAGISPRRSGPRAWNVRDRRGAHVACVRSN